MVLLRKYMYGLVWDGGLIDECVCAGPDEGDDTKSWSVAGKRSNT